MNTDTTIEELENRGIKVKHVDPIIHSFDIVDYDDVDFGDLIVKKSYEFYNKFNKIQPNLLILGWATYLAVLAWKAKQLGMQEAEINEPTLFGLCTFVISQQHAIELAFNDNGYSAQMYYKEHLANILQLGEAPLDD